MDVDVIVMGATLAGCTAASRPGRAERSVAPVKERKPEALKKLCIHALQAHPTPLFAWMNEARRTLRPKRGAQ